ncbi:MAG: GLUG motif-containing protein [Nanoarchaeota archaeon]
MKKSVVFGIFFIFICFSFISAFSFDDLFGKITGKAIGGATEIRSWNDLQNMKNDLDGDYVLMNNLDENSFGYQNYNSGLGFEPIGFGNCNGADNFKGSFDGKDYTIKGLYINRPTNSDVGLFGCIWTNTTIKNFNLEEIRIIGNNYVGGVVGNTYGINNSLLDISVSGNVSGNDSIGGAVGYLAEGNLAYRISANGNVLGEENVGGLVGHLSGFLIESIYSGNVDGNQKIGGLVGYSNGDVSLSSVKGIVSGSSRVGGLVGVSASDISYSNFNGQINGGDEIGGLIGYSFVGSKITNSYSRGEINGSGNYVGGLIGFSFSNLSDSYHVGGVGGSNYVGGLIGQNQGDKVINSYSNGKVNGSGNYVGGLVGINKGIIDRSYFSGNVYGNNYVGGLIGENNERLTLVSAQGDFEGNNYVGGLIGNNTNRVFYSYVIGDVNGLNDVGGLIGNNIGSINNSYAEINIIGTNNIGGLVGYNRGIIKDVFVSGRANGVANIGGLVGENNADISNVYSNVYTNGTTKIGGLIGKNNAGAIKDVFAIGNVKGTNFIGGLIGSFVGGSVNNLYLYWDTSFGDLDYCLKINNEIDINCTVRPNDLNYFKGNVSLREPMINWDFINIWKEVDTNYPVLKFYTTLPAGSVITSPYPTSTCSSSDLSACNDESSCQDNSGFWYGNDCYSESQRDEGDEDEEYEELDYTSARFWELTERRDTREFYVGEKINMKLDERQRVRIKFDNDVHYVGVVELSGRWAVISVASDPQKVQFFLGDEKMFDVDGDGIGDLSIELESIRSDYASVIVKRVSKRMPIRDVGGDTEEADLGYADVPSEYGVKDFVIFILGSLIVLMILYAIMGKKKIQKLEW